MKRVLWIFLALLLFAAPAIAGSTTVEGDWELISIVIEGNIYENLAQQGMTMTMRLEADGTGVQTVNGEEYPCTWTEEDGAILIDDGNGSMAYVLQSDGTLAGEDQTGDSMIFARAAAADSVVKVALTAITTAAPAVTARASTEVPVPRRKKEALSNASAQESQVSPCPPRPYEGQGPAGQYDHLR